jgi:hypothetical protein
MQPGEIERENPARICNQIKLEWLQSTKQVSSSYEREIRSSIKEKFQTISELEALLLIKQGLLELTSSAAATTTTDSNAATKFSSSIHAHAVAWLRC